MAELLPVEEAQALAVKPVRPSGVERVMLTAALGRVLAEEAHAPADQPAYDNSAMDGYAVRSADLAQADELRVVAELFAGAPALRALGPGEACRIMTGAAVPDGADAVVMQEHTERLGERVRVLKPVGAGDHIRRRGEELRAGDRLLARGVTLGAAEIGALASARRASLLVARRPEVAILATGDELRDFDQALDGAAIADSNSYALEALVRETGGEPRRLPLVGDRREALRAAMEQAARADLIVSTGGVSVGERDHVKEVLAELGAEFNAWRVDMKPGKPVALAVLGGTPYYGLPGNPVSAMVAFALFVRPAIRTALGCEQPFDLERATAILDGPLRTGGDRRQYLRARLWFADGRLRARVMARQGSGMLTSMIAANGLVVAEAGRRELEAGAEVPALIIGRLGKD
jgi:molybdopterin molybdotransferase